MKTLELSVAGKTFLAGEYLALRGGPALVLATEPRFRLKVQMTDWSVNPFHPQSPAGLFWDSKKDFFSGYQMQFEDPYQVGGFGASSAQFALLHAFWQMKDNSYVEAERFYDWHEMLMDYRNLPNSGTPPSGADVMGAVSGGITWFDRNNGKLQAFAWPFQEIQFFLAHTGKKLATHEHLNSLGDFETAGFEKSMQDVHQGLSQVNFETFLKGLSGYRSQLEAQGKVAEHTLALIRQFAHNPEILFSKGCGAMGNDVVLVLCLKENSDSVRGFLGQSGLKVMADSSAISPGLQIRNLTQNAGEVTV